MSSRLPTAMISAHVSKNARREVYSIGCFKLKKVKGCMYGIIICSILFGICSIIGISTYIFGCDDILKPNCINYSKVNTTVIGYETHISQCKDCNKTGKKCREEESKLRCSNECIDLKTWICYSTVVKIRSGDIKCDTIVGKNKLEASVSILEANNTYPIGLQQSWLIHKTTGECEDPQRLENNLINGLVFLIFTGISAVFLILSIIMHRIHLQEVKDQENFKKEIQANLYNIKTENHLNSEQHYEKNIVLKIDEFQPVATNNKTSSSSIETFHGS